MTQARFLLDTNALREPLRPSPSAPFLQRFRAHRTSLAVAATTWHEALFGMMRMDPGRKRDAVESYLHEVIRPTVDVLPYDDEAARWHAVERARLERLGTPVAFADGTIAAVAARFGLAVVTRDLADLGRFHGLTVVDWTRD